MQVLELGHAQLGDGDEVATSGATDHEQAVQLHRSAGATSV